MKRIFGLSAVLLLAASGHSAFASTGTLQSPNPYWAVLGLAMSGIAIGIYLRAKSRGQQSMAMAAA